MLFIYLLVALSFLVGALSVLALVHRTGGSPSLDRPPTLAPPPGIVGAPREDPAPEEGEGEEQGEDSAAPEEEPVVAAGDAEDAAVPPQTPTRYMRDVVASAPSFAAWWNTIHPQLRADFAPWLNVGISTTAQSAVLHANKPKSEACAVHTVTLLGGLPVFNEWTLERESDPGLLEKMKLFVSQLHSVLRVVTPPNVTVLFTMSSLPYLTDGPPRAAAPAAPANPVGLAGGGDAVRAVGTDKASQYASSWAPVLSMAKRPTDWDVLMPNPYFASLATWDAELKGLVSRSKTKYPWARRLVKLHWRGACSGRFEGMLPRLRVMLAWADQPGMDLGAWAGWGTRLRAPSPVPFFPSPQPPPPHPQRFPTSACCGTGTPRRSRRSTLQRRT